MIGLARILLLEQYRVLDVNMVPFYVTVIRRFLFVVTYRHVMSSAKMTCLDSKHFVHQH